MQLHITLNGSRTRTVVALCTLCTLSTQCTQCTP